MKKLYSITAVVLLNTLLLFGAVNVVAALLLAGDRTADGPVTYGKTWLIDAYGFDLLKQGYPGWQDDDLRVLLAETSNWPQIFEPFTQFRPRPRADTYITIDPAGFRPSPAQRGRPAEAWRAVWQRQIPDDTAIDLFVFGGSTTMGAGVPDAATIPAQLQARLDRDCSQRVRVFNFGRGFYYSTQERILFEKLLLAGAAPDIALFIDGLNDFYFPADTPRYSDRFTKYMEAANKAIPPVQPNEESFADIFVRMLEALPVWRLWRDRAPALIAVAAAVEFAPPAGREVAATAVIERWHANSRMIRAVADDFGVRPLFVWQPVPTWGYDLDDMNVARAGKLDFGRHALSAVGYRQMAQRHATGETDDDFLWLGDLQQDAGRNLYVDAVHYTEAFSEVIAGAIFERLVANGTLVCGP